MCIYLCLPKQGPETSFKTIAGKNQFDLQRAQILKELKVSVLFCLFA